MAKPQPVRAGEPASAQGGAIIRAAGLGKKFRIYGTPWGRLSEWLSAGRTVHHEAFWALRGVSFDVKRGDSLGVIGVNGSGKSTLLKILTGAMYPTDGTFHVDGRVLSLLELGTGLNPQLTGRQNVLQSASLLAFPAEHVQSKLPEIESFADLGDFFDKPIRLYSSGMLVRLAFSLFACLEPDVFVVDEALSVGDVFFQQKCVKRIEQMRERGTTMLFVSHDMQLVRRLCPRVLLLSHGKADFLGPTDEGVSRYYSLMRPEADDAATPPLGDGNHAPPDRYELLGHDILSGARSRHGSRALELAAATFTDDSGQHRLVVAQMRTGTIRLLLRAARDIANPTAGLHLYDRLGNLVFAAGTMQLGLRVPPMRAGDNRVLTFRLTLSVQPGEYTLSLGCADLPVEGAAVGELLDQHEGIGPIAVHPAEGPAPFYGAARLPMEASL